MNYLKKLWGLLLKYFVYTKKIVDEKPLVDSNIELISVVNNIENIISLDKSIQTDINLQNGFIVTIEEYYNRMNIV